MSIESRLNKLESSLPFDPATWMARVEAKPESDYGIEIAMLTTEQLQQAVEYHSGLQVCVSPGQGGLTDEDLAALSDDELNLMVFQGMTFEEATAGRVTNQLDNDQAEERN